MSEIELFTNGEFSLNIAPHEGGSFRVQAPELSRTLGFHSARDMLRTIPEEEKGWELSPTPGGDQRVGYVTEAGFYRAMGQRQAARVPDQEAREVVARFQNWVYREVLPKLRRGELVPAQASAPTLPQSYADALRELAGKVEENDRLAGQVAELAPAAESWNILASADGDYLVADAAKILCRDPRIAVGQNRLFTVMREVGWVYRGAADRKWRTKQPAIESGRLSEIPMSHYHPRTGELVLDPPQIRVTVKGMQWLHQYLTGDKSAKLALPAGASA